MNIHQKIKLARLTVIAALMFMAVQPAQAQRCPAGADAFGSCLPLDHRYGGPGQVQRATPAAPRLKMKDFRCKPWQAAETCAQIRSVYQVHDSWEKSQRKARR
jgi:hypothetical protein